MLVHRTARIHQQEQLESLNDKLQKSDEQMRELELKLEQKVQLLKEREEMAARLKEKIERLQRMPVSKFEQFMQDGMKRIGRRKR